MAPVSEADTARLLYEVNNLVERDLVKERTVDSVFNEVANALNETRNEAEEKIWTCASARDHFKLSVKKAIRDEFSEKHAWRAFWKFGSVVLDVTKVPREYRSQFTQKKDFADTISKYNQCIESGEFDRKLSQPRMPSQNRGAEGGVSSISSMSATADNQDDGCLGDSGLEELKLVPSSKDAASRRSRNQDGAVLASAPKGDSDLEENLAAKRMISSSHSASPSKKRRTYAEKTLPQSECENDPPQQSSKVYLASSTGIQEPSRNLAGDSFQEASEITTLSDSGANESSVSTNSPSDAITIRDSSGLHPASIDLVPHEGPANPAQLFHSGIISPRTLPAQALNATFIGEKFETSARKSCGVSADEIKKTFSDLQNDTKEIFIRLSQCIGAHSPGFVAILAKELALGFPETIKFLVEDQSSQVGDYGVRAIFAAELGNINLPCLLTALFSASILEPIFCSSFSIRLKAFFNLAEAGAELYRNQGRHRAAESQEIFSLHVATGDIELAELKQDEIQPLVEKLTHGFSRALGIAFSKVLKTSFEEAMKALEEPTSVILEKYAILHCRMSIGAERYAFDMPRMGSRFDPETMVTEASGTAGSEERTSRVVSLALSPVIYVRRPIFGDGVPTLEEPKVISKAYVLLI